MFLTFLFRSAPEEGFYCKPKYRAIFFFLNKFICSMKLVTSAVGISLPSVFCIHLAARNSLPSPLIFEPKQRPGVEAARYFVSPKEACPAFERVPKLYLKVWICHMQIHISSPGWKTDNVGKSPLKGGGGGLSCLLSPNGTNADRNVLP